MARVLRPGFDINFKSRNPAEERRILRGNECKRECSGMCRGPAGGDSREAATGGQACPGPRLDSNFNSKAKQSALRHEAGRGVLHHDGFKAMKKRRESNACNN